MGGQRAQLGSFADQLRGGLLDVVTLRSLDAVPGTAGTTQDGQQRRAQYRGVHSRGRLSWAVEPGLISGDRVGVSA